MNRLAPLVVLLALFGAWAWSPGSLIARAHNDFLAFYCGGRLAGTGHLYDANATLALHQEVVGEKIGPLLFIRLPFYALLFKPLSMLPYLAAFWVWTAVNLASIGLFAWRMAPRAPDLPYLCAFSVPLLCGLANGQDVPLLLGLLTLAWTRLERGDDVSGGAILALCSIKLHLMLPLYGMLALMGRWRALMGLAAAGLGLAAVSFGVEGWDWPRQYLAMIARPGVHQDPASMGNLVGMLASLGLDSPWVDALLHISVLGLLSCGRGLAAGSVVAMALAAGLLVGRHSYLQDFALLLPAYALAAPHIPSIPMRVVCQLMVAPFLYLILLSGPPWSALPPAAVLAVLASAALFRRAHAASTTPPSGETGPVSSTSRNPLVPSPRERSA